MPDFAISEPKDYNTCYEIKGFRSLLDFKIFLSSGINVLVGPNGSGKTNYIEFLDFVDNTIKRGAAAAVSSAGGVARVFSIENIKKKSPILWARITSVAEISISADSDEIRYFDFVYELEIKFSRKNSSIYISREIINIKKLRNINDKSNVHVGSISIIRKSPLEEDKPIINITKKLFTKNARNPLSIQNRLFYNKEIKFIIERLDPSSLMADESIFSIRNSIPAIDSIRTALTHGRSFNISPMRAREPDDLVRMPGIYPDGSGLSSTLHHLQTVKNARNGRRALRLRRVSAESMDMVADWTKLVFPDLESISVVQDPHTGKYLAFLIVGNDQKLKIPLQSASDGTVKWLSFVCLIVSSGGLYSIEEPENYLHPKMQQYLVELIRESLFDQTENESFIISTHSETIINQCKAEELIIFDFSNGSTSCSRLTNPNKVSEEINKTGFGLGYYYASNTL